MKKMTRKRKKLLKKQGMYVDPCDTLNLKKTIGKYVYPRLKLFREINDGYPCDCPEIESIEKWNEILDEMITAFRYLAEGDSWEKSKEYNWISELGPVPKPGRNGRIVHVLDISERGNEMLKNMKKEERRRREVIEKGLMLFAKYSEYLWW